MAEQFGAELTLRDNFVAVIERAIQATREFKSQIAEVQGYMDKMAHTNASPEIKAKVNSESFMRARQEIEAMQKMSVKVEAKLGSSFGTVKSEIDHAIVKDKEVKITAKDEVTHTVNNVQRYLFEQSGKLNANFDGAFKNIGAGANTALNKVATMTNAIANVGRTLATATASNVFSRGMGAAESAMTGVIPGVAAGGTAGLMLRGRTNILAQDGINVKDIDDGTKVYNPRRIPFWKRNHYTDENGSPDNEVHENNVGTGHGDIKPSWGKDQRGRFTKSVFDDEYARMIQRQQDVMSRSFNNNNYLSKKRIQPISLGDGDYTNAVIRDANMFERAYFTAIDKIKSKLTGLKSSFRMFSATNNMTIGVKMAANGVKEKLMSLWTMTAKPREMIVKAAFTGERALYHAKNMVGDLTGGAKNVVLSAIDKTKETFSKVKTALAGFATGHPILMKIAGGAYEGIKKIGSALKTIASKAWNVTVKVAGGALKMLESIASKLKEVAKGAIIGVGVAGAAGLVKGMQGAEELESNRISMEHFIGLNNGGDKAKTIATTDDYMARIKKITDKSPFEDADIMGAARQGITISGGDINKAEKYTNLATDMASLTPGKSVKDAMEALADANTGEMERLKEFGFKISADDYKAAGGDLFKLKDAKGRGLANTFEGGADKFSNSFKGKKSNITGGLQAGLTAVGKPINDYLAKAGGPMDKLIAKMQSFQKMGPNIGKNIADGISKAINAFDKFSKTPAFKAIQKTISTVVDWVKAHLPQMTTIVKGVMDMIGRNIEKSGPVIQKIIGWFGKVVDWVADHMPQIKQVVNDVMDGVSWAIDKVMPIIEDIGKVAGAAANIFLDLWPGIKGVIQTMAAIVTPLLDAIKLACDGIAWAAQAAANALDTLLGKKGQVDNNAGTGGNTTQVGGWVGHANGLARVPYDNYQALLHEGERVLTKQEASQVASKSNNGGIYKVDINVHGTTDPDTVAERVVKKLHETVNNMGGAPVMG